MTTLTVRWLAERHRRWPVSANPYLLVTDRTAVDPIDPCMSFYVIHRTLKPVGLNLQQLRQDRILHEARETADPLHLMRLFGLSAAAAMRYIRAAHPEKTARPPR